MVAALIVAVLAVLPNYRKDYHVYATALKHQLLDETTYDKTVPPFSNRSSDFVPDQYKVP